MNITRKDVTDLRSEAGEAGDLAMVEICDLALSNGDVETFNRGDHRFDDETSHAWRKCLNAIEALPRPNYPEDAC